MVFIFLSYIFLYGFLPSAGKLPPRKILLTADGAAGPWNEETQRALPALGAFQGQVWALWFKFAGLGYIAVRRRPRH